MTTATPADQRVTGAMIRLDALLRPANEGEVTVGTVDLETVLDELEHLRNSERCCPAACSGGACESCRCCAAGWCVTGVDGLPEDAGNLALWIEVAREHNPIVEAWAAERAELDRLRATEARLREVCEVAARVAGEVDGPILASDILRVLDGEDT